MRSAALMLAALGAVAGCKEEKRSDPAAASAALDTVRSAALQALATGPTMPKTVEFRGVQTYPQAAPQRFAVCGLVSAFKDDPAIFVPFVTTVTVASPPGTPARYEFDSRVGTTTSEATRVYSALVASCWAGGGPAPGRPLALPPLPDAIADPHATAAPDTSVKPSRLPVVPAMAATSGEVTLRQAANIHATPGGATVRTAPAGVPLHVFATAPGGWRQVGDTAPFGWVHESMVAR